jgi:hypothetical protein
MRDQIYAESRYTLRRQEFSCQFLFKSTVESPKERQS